MQTIQATQAIADAVYLLAISEGPLRRRLQLVKPIILEASAQGAPVDLRPELEMLQTWIHYSGFPGRPLQTGKIKATEYAKLLLRLCFALLSRSATVQAAAALLEPVYESSDLAGRDPGTTVRPC